MKVILVSTYELGRQPFGLASPAAWLRAERFEVTCLDLYQDKLDLASLVGADLIAFYLPMHTATRIAQGIIEKIAKLNPDAHLCAYGLYAPICEAMLRSIGVSTVLGGEFEEGLLSLAIGLRRNGRDRENSSQVLPLVSLSRQRFQVPDRTGLPQLARYAQLVMPDGEMRIVGYTEASRGCKHKCRHCPIVPVYNGMFRVVQPEIVLEDIRRQVAAGAQHITFGDPDFFNGIKHAIQIVRELHHAFPGLTYDVVIKIEHLLKHSAYLPTLKETGCLFITSAVESVDDRILAIFDKGHSRDDFLRTVALCRESNLDLIPTFVAFSPWISLDGYADLLDTLDSLDLVDNLPPVQLSIRLLIPMGSRLLEMEEVQRVIGPFDNKALSYQWTHSDHRVDDLQKRVAGLVQVATRRGHSRRRIFDEVKALVDQIRGCNTLPVKRQEIHHMRATVPYLNEPWYC